jgi:hypothetical protein
MAQPDLLVGDTVDGGDGVSRLPHKCNTCDQRLRHDSRICPFKESPNPKGAAVAAGGGGSSAAACGGGNDFCGDIDIAGSFAPTCAFTGSSAGAGVASTSGTSTSGFTSGTTLPSVGSSAAAVAAPSTSTTADPTSTSTTSQTSAPRAGGWSGTFSGDAKVSVGLPTCGFAEQEPRGIPTKTASPASFPGCSSTMSAKASTPVRVHLPAVFNFFCIL